MIPLIPTMTAEKGYAKKNEYYPCDLCGLPVEVEGFDLLTGSGPKRFCCEGCIGIFKMLHEDEILPQDAAGYG